jgi:ABC-type dipeptide/oligopeptide/nickel transport system ATPase subunit
VELYHKILNEDSLSEHYEFDLCFIFSKLNDEKIIIEDESFIQKSITLSELAENIEKEKTTLILDKSIENSPFQIRIAENDARIKRLLTSLIYKELNLIKGNCQYYKLATKLPELIDTKNFDKFVGRNIDIENLVKKILTIKNENKILTIKGAGGIGKTTLLSKTVNEIALRGKFKDGINFVQCEFVKDYDDFENKISMAFDMNNAINFKIQLKEQINQENEERLIILDNVETILHLDDTNLIKEFIKFISDFATIILTSREKLNEEYESVYELRELSTDEAEELFLNYYELKKYDKIFLRAEILENMLNNNPLAIKLVTANLPKNKNLKLLKKELDDSFFDITSKNIENIFVNESDMNIERTKSLFNSINYSYLRLTQKEKLALELLSLFPDGIYFEHFKEFYNKKEDKGENNKKTIKKKIENFSDRDLKSLEDKSLIINANQRINLQSIIGRFADYKFQNKSDEEQIEFYKKAYIYNAFVLRMIDNVNIKNSLAAHVFDNNKNNFLKCLDYLKVIKIKENHISFINDLCNYFAMSCSPNEKVIQKLNILKQSVNENTIEKEFLNIQVLTISYFYGNFDLIYEKIKKDFPLNEIINKGIIKNKIESWYTGDLLNIYGMEGHQYEEVKFDLCNKRLELSMFYIGDFSLIKKYINKYNNKNLHGRFIIFELELCCDNLNKKILKKYIESLYKTQFIDKMQSTYTLLKADKSGVILKEIKKLIVTNPFTDGLKTLMLAMKNDQDCSKIKYEEAINKLYHIRYYHVEAILLYSEYLQEKCDIDYKIWLDKGRKLASKHCYRYLLHKFNCLELGINSTYDENKYNLPEELDYTDVIKEYDL